MRLLTKVQKDLLIMFEIDNPMGNAHVKKAEFVNFDSEKGFTRREAKIVGWVVSGNKKDKAMTERELYDLMTSRKKVEVWIHEKEVDLYHLQEMMVLSEVSK